MTLQHIMQQHDLYALIQWPWVQELMEYPWFRSECILYQSFDEQEYLSSAYFVPLERLNEIQAGHGIYQ